MAATSFILLATLAISGLCRGFPSGAPESTCMSMMPSHRVDPKNKDGISSPYVITLVEGKNTYMPNKTVEVTLHALDAGVLLRGFLLEARTVSGVPAGPVGTFVNVSKTTKAICNRKALTHKTWRSYDNFDVTWFAPPEDVGPIVFVATMIQNYRTFWVDVKSDVLNPFVPPPPENLRQMNVTEACSDEILAPLPTERPHVAMLCAEHAQCPCDWLCCQSCERGVCASHAICRRTLL